MNPLIKRLPRELKHNLGKYLGIFLLMCGSVALTSGFLLAAHSITVIMDGMREEYNIEDGRFSTSFEATSAQLKAAAKEAKGKGGVSIYENFSIDAALKKEAGDDGTKRTLRTYVHRTKVDIAAYCEGKAPKRRSEVAVDRVFATNNDLAVGDTVKLCGRAYRISGIMTQPDSQALFPNNSDFTVNTLTYGVAEVSKAGFAALEKAGGAPAYVYSFCFKDRDLSVAERTDIEKDMMSALSDAGATVDELIDAGTNQGIGYAADDVSGDSGMWFTLLQIIVVIMAFAFVVLTSATIEEESAIIGTLLASGYRRRELVAHYLMLPAIVGVLAAGLGTGLGLTCFTGPMKDLYYGSYSLPPFYVSWDWSVFVSTAVVPVLVLVGVTFVGLVRKMGKTPLQFLRHEASGKSGTKRGFALPERLGFVARFRLRVFLRNLGNFATLFMGLGFASLLLLFGLAVLPTMQHFGDNLKYSVVAEHQYTLKAPLEIDGTDEERAAWSAVAKLQSVESSKVTAIEDAADELEAAADALKSAPSVDAMQRAQTAQDDFYSKVDAVAADLGVTRSACEDLLKKVEDIDLDDESVHPVNTVDNGTAKIEQAEKYAVYQLEYERGGSNGTETISIYGVQENSRYWKDLNVGDGHVVVGAGLVDKFDWTAGTTVKLYDKFEDETHKIEYEGESSTWGTKSNTNIYMSLADFNEFFGNDAAYFNGYASDKALKLDARYFASELTPDDMQAVGDQFVGMMQDLIGMMVGLAVFIFVLFIYLLTKAVLDHSARSISYMKVFGYRDGEISKLYLRSITLCTLVSLVVLQPLIIASLTAIFHSMLASYSGNLEIYVPAEAIAETILAGFASYLAVAVLHMRSIKKVPLSEALKVQE